MKKRPQKRPSKKSKKRSANTPVKLASWQVEEVREMYATGLFSYGGLAKLFGCSKQGVAQLVRQDRRYVDWVKEKSP